MKKEEISRLEAVIMRGLEHLRKEQAASGSFPGLSSADRIDFSRSRSTEGIFLTALILRSLALVPASSDIKDKAAGHLLSEKSDGWTWNYWQRGSLSSKEYPYPDDLDDTFVALSALMLWRPEIFTPEVMVKVAKLLTFMEVKPGGPYRTWLVPSTAGPAWKDVDVAVNANVAYFLHLCGVDLGGLNEMISSALDSGRLSSPYYPGPLPLAHYISLSGKHHINLQRVLMKRKPSSGALNTALYVCAMLASGVPSASVAGQVRRLVSLERSEGGWAAEGFCLDPEVNGSARFAGSSALTTAFVLEAFSRFIVALKKEARAIEEKPVRMFLEKVYGLAEKRSKDMPPALRTEWKDLAVRIRRADLKGAVVLLPYYFRQGSGAKGKKIKSDMLLRLAYGNLCGWMAYTAYDDVLDGEARKEGLNAANAALRELVHVYHSIFPEDMPGWQKFREVMDKVDGGNAWEVMNCKVDISHEKLGVPKDMPNIQRSGSLYAKSLGHAMSALSIMLLGGYPVESDEFRATEEFFRHYLTARQMNDDAHDWLEDLRRGRLNFASVRVLRHYAPGRKLDLGKEEKKMQKIFWEKEISKIGRSIHREVGLARLAVKKMPLRDTAFLEGLLGPLDKAAEDAIKESRNARDFIRMYSSAKY